jgi:hypothetical protein
MEDLIGKRARAAIHRPVQRGNYRVTIAAAHAAAFSSL